MSHAYRAVGWNRQKKLYDVVLAGCVLGFLVVFVAGTLVLHPGSQNNVEMVLIRGLGLCAFVLLHVVLSIGPLCRLDARFLPLLYNRRHLGVTLFLVGLLHGLFALMLYHGLGDMNPLVSMFVANTNFRTVADFPFQPFGFFALVILFLMAATSHDFWLANLTAPVWKALHMLVYVAYALLVLHVGLGFLQAETSPWIAGATGLGLVWICGLHGVAGWGSRGLDRPCGGRVDEDGFVDVAAVDGLAEKRGMVVHLGGDRVAVFRYDGKVSALSNACQHQNGPLGEGRIIDGFVTCPWHGYQYDPASGASPPPFTEKVPTFNVKVRGGRVWVHPRPNPAGTLAKAALVEEGAALVEEGAALVEEEKKDG